MEIQFKKALSEISHSALSGDIEMSLNKLRQLCIDAGLKHVLDRVEKITDDFHAMCLFESNGGVDPNRLEIRDSIVCETLALAMECSRCLMMNDSTSTYFSTARTLSLRKPGSISDIVNKYKNELARLENDYESFSNPQRSLKAEQILTDIFNVIWTTHPLSKDDWKAIDTLMSAYFPSHARALAISAVGLGHMTYYDSNRLNWLLKKYLDFSEKEPALALRALVEALSSLIRYSRRPLNIKTKYILSAIKEIPFAQRDLASVTIELMRTATTKQVSEKINKGLIIDIERLSRHDKELRDKIANGQIDLESLVSDVNPEWEDEINKSSLGDNLKELAELQAEGADVFMASFSHMKQFPFFRDLANWFIPFYQSHSVVASDNPESDLISTILSKMPVLCDSDKYSLAYSFKALNSAQLDQLASTFKMQSEQMAEQFANALQPGSDQYRRNIINKYIQNQYRAATLFRGGKDITSILNIDDKHPDLLQIKYVGDMIMDNEIYETIAQFYFKNHFWNEAIAAFKELNERLSPDIRKLQQLGYALERTGQLSNALQVYEQAEMLGDSSDWVRRRIAFTQYSTGYFAKAAEYYKILSDGNPNDAKLAKISAQAYFDAEEYVKAENAYYKALYLIPDSTDIQRSLAWTQFLNGKADKAKATYERILETDPLDVDYLHLGLIEWFMGDIDKAKTLLLKSARLNKDGGNFIEDKINYYAPKLKEVGADMISLKDLMDFVHDKINNN